MAQKNDLPLGSLSHSLAQGPEAETLRGRKELASIKVYPNPAKDYVIFDVSHIDQRTTLSVYDIYGREIIEKQITETPITLDTKSWSTGLYLWRVNQEGISSSQGKVEIMKW